MKIIQEKILEELARALISRKETIAAAESVTGGLLQNALSNMPDASQVYQGGITVYNLAQKFKHLGVEPMHALQVNCVSEKVAVEMSGNVCTLFGSHWGLSTTGYATKVEESGFRLFAYYAITHNRKTVQKGELTSSYIESDDVQWDYVHQLLRKLKPLVTKKKNK